MCGIAGIVGPDANEDILKKLLSPIAHRGEISYRNEFLILPGMAIGAHRLAIVGEPTGKQPKYDNEQKVYSVFNGEIYNHKEIKQQLEANIEFLSNCDSEAVLKAYQEWGDDFVHHLDGKFGIAIYDENQKLLLLARDPMGVKPLYYAKYRNSWIFSSELKSFIALSDEIKEIKELEPGSIWKNNVVSKYFTLGQFSNHLSSNSSISDYMPQLKERLTEAVRKRIPLETPRIACLLSGGVDSSIITYLASKIHPKVVAYTLAAPGMPSSDLEAAEILCKHLNIEHIIVSPSVNDMQDFYLQEGVYMTESFEPVLVRNAVSYNFVCRKVTEDGFKFCLNGEGADELFGGYDFVREAPLQLQDKIIWHSLSIIHKTYLQMADRASMYTTLEARVPFMDKDLVNFCLTLPSKARMDDMNNKIILRKLFENELPGSIAHRRKTGMNEGAGFGVNASDESIFYKAIKNYYDQNPDIFDDHMLLCKKFEHDVQIDLSSIEEVYHFAEFNRHNYLKFKDGVRRLQLNTKLKKESLDHLSSLAAN